MIRALCCFNVLRKSAVKSKIWRQMVTRTESKWVFSVSEETIQFLNEFKFLEESFTGRTCISCQY